MSEPRTLPASHVRPRQGPRSLRAARKAAVTVVGVGLVVLGAILLVLPGPGFLVIVAGLAVLATEYVWAHTLLAMSKDRALALQRETIANPLRTALTILCGVLLIGAGVALVVAEQLPFSGAWTGGSVVVSGVILLTATVVTVIYSRGGPSAID